MAEQKNYFELVDLKIDFPVSERERMERWYKNGVVDKYLHKNDKSDKYYSFMDGPITANNPMGVHHAWGRTYKDLWQKYKNMQGYKQRFQNGFDCQGLWVEVEVEKELELRNKKEIEDLVPGDKKASIDKFVNLCKERVLKFSGIQTEQTKRLGNFMDWEHSYYTMSDENNYMIWHFLKVCFEQGWIYKGRDSVAWCPRCETAISQHEMLTEDYKEVVHKAIYLEFPIENREKEYLIIWTTTPWTIPANIAVAVDEKLDYALVEGTTGDKYWVAKDRVEALFGKDGKIVKTAKGKELVGLKYKGPFDDLPAVKEASGESDLFHTVVATDEQIMPITTTEGTGLVHTAVSAGAEDFKLGKKIGLSMIPVIADNADYLPELGFLTGQNAKKHPEIIIDYLKKREEENGENWIFNVENYKHRYPACWRCKTELVWKVADEWYISMDRPAQNASSDAAKKTLRERMIATAKKIKWLPEFGLDRELDWLNNMHDWLISKPNRYWGLALPIYECKKCGHFEVLGSKDELKEKAVEGWEEFDGHTPHKPWIDEVKIKCSECGETVERLGDVGNVWLDAGIVPFSTIKENNQGEPLYLTNREEWNNWFPIDFITESFPGQFKNWFYSLIAMSTVLTDENPMKTVLGFGSLLAEDGRPMHKSWGNSIEFNEGADKIGADVMRWMYLRANPSENMLFGYKLADETRRQFHLKLWNIYNYFITYANISGWNPDTQSSESTLLDKWILSRLNNTIKLATESLDQFHPQTASLAIEGFVDDLSVWYIRRSRDREDTSFYKTTYEVLIRLTALLAPFMPYISDSMYTNLTKEETVHLANWPGVDEKSIDNDLEAKMSLVREVVEKGHAQRKEAQIKVRQPLSKITVENAEIDEGLAKIAKEELNVKSLEYKMGEGELKVSLDTNITPELEKEGEAREIVRNIQIERKNLGTKLDQKVDVALPEWPKEHEEDIVKKALINNLQKGDFKVTPV
jgi:isoleucyl-tRNA synthetase